MLSYDIPPSELESWMSSFHAYVENGKGLGNKAIVAYIRKFLDEEYRQSNVYSLINDDASIDEIEKILKDDLEIRIPLSNRRVRLFHMQRKEDEELLQFVLRVKENARYAEVDKLPVEDIISLIITSRCNIKQLTDTWALRRTLSLRRCCSTVKHIRGKSAPPKTLTS